MGKKKIVSLLLMVLFFNVLFISTDVVAGKQYEIPAGESALGFSPEEFSLMNLEIDNSISSKPFSFELKNQFDMLLASRVNYTKNLIMSFVGSVSASGAYTATIYNNNNETIELSIIQESFKLYINDETDGFSHKKKVYAWYFNSDVISTYKVLPVESLKERSYYDMYVVSLTEDILSSVWLSDSHPSEDSGWNEYLDPYGYVINSKKQVRLDPSTNWLVYDILQGGTYDILIFLKSTIPGTILITISGIVIAGVGITVFVLYYYNPLKYRKRKIKGESYDSVKDEFENPEDVGDTLRDLLTSDKDK